VERVGVTSGRGNGEGTRQGRDRVRRCGLGEALLLQEGKEASAVGRESAHRRSRAKGQPENETVGFLAYSRTSGSCGRSALGARARPTLYLPKPPRLVDPVDP
jgi:hypothetical protein